MQRRHACRFDVSRRWEGYCSPASRHKTFQYENTTLNLCRRGRISVMSDTSTRFPGSRATPPKRWSERNNSAKQKPFSDLTRQRETAKRSSGPPRVHGGQGHRRGQGSFCHGHRQQQRGSHRHRRPRHLPGSFYRQNPRQSGSF